MTIKKQTFIMSVLFHTQETYAESAIEAISHRLFNEDGVIDWDFKLLKEYELNADIADEDLEGVEDK